MNYKGSFIVISHDRYFLDKVTNETIELQEDMDLAGNYAKKVFIHEIVHGILEECGLKQDEGFVLPFSNCLYSVIKDNPKIFNPNTCDID